MSKLEVLAGSCLLIALIAQAWYFRKLFYHLRELRRSIPPPGSLRQRSVGVPLAEIEATPAEILVEKYSKESLPSSSVSKVIRLSLLHAEAYENPKAYQIVVAINSYLVRSRGAVIDFVLIKNLVERHVRLYEQRIRYEGWIPLLVGVVALFFAGSVGLFLLPDVSEEVISRAAVAAVTTIFFSSIKWVTLSVLTGVILTLVTLGILYPRAHWEILRRKSELFTLIQTELLPSLFQDTTHSLHLLQTSLNSFQHGFAESIDALQGLLNRNYETLKAQERIADALQQVDIMQLAKANVDMFQALGKSAEGLDQFRTYLSQMNHFVENTTTLTDKVNHFLFRTEHIETIAAKIKETLDQNDRLHHFIASHFSELEDRSQLITQAVVKVDDVLDKSLGELMEHTQHKIRAIRDLSAQEENQLLKTYEENKHVFGKLARIDDLHQNFADYKTKSLRTQEQVLEQLQLLNERLTRGGVGGMFKKLFGS